MFHLEPNPHLRCNSAELPEQGEDKILSSTPDPNPTGDTRLTLVAHPSVLTKSDGTGVSPNLQLRNVRHPGY